MARSSASLDEVFRLVDQLLGGVLRLAGSLIRLAFIAELVVVRQRSGGFLDFPFYFVGRTAGRDSSLTAARVSMS